MEDSKEKNIKKDFTDKEFDQEFFLNESQRVANIGSYLLDINTGYWTSSKQLDVIFGIDSKFKKNIEGWLNIVHPDHRDMMADYFKNNVLKRKEKFNKDYKIMRHDNGQTAWVQGLGELILDREGNPIRMLGTIQDITDRKKMEDNCKKQSKELKRLNNFFIGRDSNLSKKISDLEGKCSFSDDSLEDAE